MTYAVFLPGKAMTVWASSVRRAIAKTSARFSSIHLATPAHSLCANASSHSAFAAFRHLAERFNAANSNSCSEFVEHSNRYSKGGKFTGISLGDAPSSGALLRQVLRLSTVL